MANADIDAIRRYHEHTKHSVARLQTSQHFLDWEIQPRPFKIYPTLEPIPLPRDWPDSSAPALEAIVSPGEPPGTDVVPDLTALARLLHFSAGITRRKVHPGGHEMHFRAAACTGALYHIDLYLVCGALPGLEAGVYHFGPHDFSLRRLRAGDYRSLIIEATAAEPAVCTAPAIFVCTSTFWRNAWKYQSRAYRHCFWDNGTILANLLAVAAADRIPLRVVLGFVDETINHLLGLDTEREAALSLVAVGHQSGGTLPPAPPAPRLVLDTLPLSTREVDYPAIRAAHSASSLASSDEVRAWRRALPADEPAPAAGQTFALPAVSPSPCDTIDQAISRRGSSRQFSDRAISLEQLSLLVRGATDGIPADFLGARGGSSSPHEDRRHLADLFLIVHAVEGLPPGTYRYRRREGTLELLRGGSLRREAGFLGLGQDLPADAAVNCYFLCDLDPVLDHFGNRGYRAAQLEAAIAGGKLYLAAYALGLGATGLTFFDDEVTEFFSPQASGASVMFLVATGVPD